MTKDPCKHSEFDPTDIAIVEILQEEGRISVSELGRKIGLSQPATSERLKRLEETGRHYRIQGDYQSLRLGFGHDGGNPSQHHP